MNIAKLVCAFVASFFPLFVSAEEVPVSLTPEPTKGLVVKTCKTGYHVREKPECLTTEFLERRGEDFVFLVQEEGSKEKKETIFNKDLGTKVRPFPYATYKPHSYFLQFPMKNGNSWKGSFEQESSNGRVQKRTRSAEVVGYGDITLPGGVFKAYEIRATNQLAEAYRPAMEKYFYCPGLAMICSYESPDFDLYQVVVEVRKTN